LEQNGAVGGISSRKQAARRDHRLDSEQAAWLRRPVDRDDRKLWHGDCSLTVVGLTPDRRESRAARAAHALNREPTVEELVAYSEKLKHESKRLVARLRKVSSQIDRRDEHPGERRGAKGHEL